MMEPTKDSEAITSRSHPKSPPLKPSEEWYQSIPEILYDYSLIKHYCDCDDSCTHKDFEASAIRDIDVLVQAQLSTAVRDAEIKTLTQALEFAYNPKNGRANIMHYLEAELERRK